MKKCFLLGAALLLGAHSGAPALAHAAGKVKVVATTPIFGEIIREVGGERVDVKVLLPAGRDVHFYEPRPSDIVKISRADLFAHGGLDLELWRGPLVEAAGKRELFAGGAGDLNCAAGITLLEVPSGRLSRSEGDVHIYGNPHYWLDPANLGIMAANVAHRLKTIDPAHAAEYESALSTFQGRLREALPRWKRKLAPFGGRDLAAYHKSWPYFGRAFNLRIDTFLEPKPNIPPSPSHLKKVTAQIRERLIPGILIEPFQHRAYAEQVASEAGTRVVLVSQLPGGTGKREDIFAWMDGLVSSVAACLAEGSAGKNEGRKP